MRKIIEHINRVSVNEVESNSNDKLILRSTPRKVGNPLFIIGITGFVISSLTRGFLHWHIGEIFLALFTIILISGVWYLSAAGKFIINKTEGKIFRVYRHLGYLQKAYSYPIHSVDKVLHEHIGNKNVIFLLLDDRKKIWVAEEEKNISAIAETIRLFLNVT